MDNTSRIHEITNRTDKRFWDGFTARGFKTVDGFKAKLKPTKGGSSVAWQNRECHIKLIVRYEDGSRVTYAVVSGIIDSITTKRSSPSATIAIQAMTKPMTEANAEIVKEGDRWYETVPLSTLANLLLEQVYANSKGKLPPDKSVAKDLLSVSTADGRIGWWNMGSAPGWDGTSFNIDNADNVTAICASGDKKTVFIGLGGVSSGTKAQLWSYVEDEQLWTKLGEMSNTDYSIDRLQYNTADGKIYGIAYKEIESQVEVELTANKKTWLGPQAFLFYWNAYGEAAGEYLDGGTHSLAIPNYFSGKYNVREMFRADGSAPSGITRDGSGKRTTPTIKTDFKAGAGNYTSFKYVNVPIGPAGHYRAANLFWRKVDRMHPQTLTTDWDSDPLMEDFYRNSNTANVTDYGELIPTTSAGFTGWGGASGTTPPNGWATAGAATFSVAGGILTASNLSSTENDGLNVSISGLEDNMTVYRLRIDGGSGYQVALSPSSYGTNSLPYGPSSPTHRHSYDASDGTDWYFSVCQANHMPNLETGTIKLSVRKHDDNSGSTFTINNLSLTVARYWDKWPNFLNEGQTAGENLPITGLTKMIGAVTTMWPSHTSSQGPDAGLWDTTPPAIGTSALGEYEDSAIDNTHGLSGTDLTLVGSPRDINYVPDMKIDLTLLEFNFIAQDRRLLPSVGDAAIHPMFGPSEAEDGISPDNSFRFKVNTRNIMPLVGYNSDCYSSEARVIDACPSTNASWTASSGAVQPQSWTAETNFESGANRMETGRAGHGFASVICQALGNKIPDDENMMAGITKWSNGQQGLFAFSQEADSGNGLILYAQLNSTFNPHDDTPFNVGPADGGAGLNRTRFSISYRFFKCSNKSTVTVGDGLVPGVAILNNQIAAGHPPYQVGSDNWNPMLPTAGCADTSGNFYVAMGEQRVINPIIDSSNYATGFAKTQILKAACGTGSFGSASDFTGSFVYRSWQDKCEYETQGAIHADYAPLNGTPHTTNAAGSKDYTRTINSLYWNPYLSDYNLIGWSFRRWNILSDPLHSPIAPCHEVFTMKNSDIVANLSKMTIVDHDAQSGTANDATSFVGFCFTDGNFGNSTNGTLGNSPATFYFRGDKATTNPSNYELVGRGLTLNYMYIDPGGIPVGGQFWDEAANKTISKRLKGNEGFLANNSSAVVLADIGTENEREVIFGSFDKYLSPHMTSDAQRLLTQGSSSHLWWKIDDREVDPYINLADFTGMKVYDALAQLSYAFDFIMGFDFDKFFMVNRLSVSNTHTFDARKGEILDITKKMDNDVRNIISMTPYKPQVKDVEYEVTHVGSEEDLADSRLFNGDFVMTVKTHREIAINLICSRAGRAIMTIMDDDTLDPVDAIVDASTRTTPLFKWLTHSPTKTVTLMQQLATTDTVLWVNTVYSAGLRKVQPGEAILFVNPETFEQTGRVISGVDTTLNTITIEENPGFIVEGSTPLTIISSNVGGGLSAGGNSEIAISSIYSSEGIGVITAADHTGSNSVLTLNSMSAFRDMVLTPYNVESYRHYSVLVCKGGADIREGSLPIDMGTDTISPYAWVKSWDIENHTITLATNNASFTDGDILGAHYALQPAILIKKIKDGSHEPPPYPSVVQDLPQGLASWHWICDDITDKFNMGDIMSFKFPGIRLVKDAASIYIGANGTSVTRYGKRPWTFPDNRFVPIDRISQWVKHYLTQYGDPRLKLQVDLPFSPDLTFIIPGGNMLRKVTIIDDIMFPSMPGFSISGYLQSISSTPSGLKTTIALRSEEKY